MRRLTMGAGKVSCVVLDRHAAKSRLAMTAERVVFRRSHEKVGAVGWSPALRKGSMRATVLKSRMAREPYGLLAEWATDHLGGGWWSRITQALDAGYLLDWLESVHPDHLQMNASTSYPALRGNGGRGVHLGRRSLWIFVSLAVSLIAFILGPVQTFVGLLFGAGNGIPTRSLVTLLIWLGWLWIATLLASLYSSGKRALWLLFAAPFALQQPIMWIFQAHACDLLGRCGGFMGLISGQQ